MNKFSKSETTKPDGDLLHFYEDEPQGALRRLAMLAAALVLPLAGTFALTERPAHSVAVVNDPAPARAGQAAMPVLYALDEKN